MFFSSKKDLKYLNKNFDTDSTSERIGATN